MEERLQTREGSLQIADSEYKLQIDAEGGAADEGGESADCRFRIQIADRPPGGSCRGGGGGVKRNFVCRFCLQITAFLSAYQICKVSLLKRIEH